jgi:hypothetical protein
MDREIGQEDWKRKQTGGRTVGKSVRIDSHEAGVTPLKLGSNAHALALAVCLLFLEHIQFLR